MKEDKKKIIVSLFVIFIMVSSIMGYIFGRSGVEKYKYNGYSFFKKNNEWKVKIEGEELGFSFFPEQVEDIEIDFDVKNILGDKVEIDTTYNPNSEYAEAMALAQFRFKQNIEKVSDSFIVRGVTEEGSEFNLPVVNCEDSTENIPVLYFEEVNNTEINLIDNCIILKGKDEIDILRANERILYSFLDIIQ